MAKVRFPYGVSNFKTLVTEGYHYVDRTMFLEKMEEMHTKYHFFLRPRRFGKSLVVSILQYYYGKQHKKDFQTLFGKYYIGQHPTPKANSFLVLKMDFSGIETSSMDALPFNFSVKVKSGIFSMMNAYKEYFDKSDLATIEKQTSAANAMNKLLEVMEVKAPREKIFLVIDEYDHFTNEIIAFHFNNFKKIVSQNGFVRKFYEIVKQGTHSGIIDRIFITGISPVTLDSLTSGFNISTNLSLNIEMHDFMGFNEKEVSQFLDFVEVPENELDSTLADLRAWYNGYLFHQDTINRLYNPDMVLFFSVEYDQLKRYPENLLDTNISSDYGKIRRMFNIGSEEGNYKVLEEIMQNGEIEATITQQFSFEKKWTRDDFISLLFYMGLLTIKKMQFGLLTFSVPNHVITELYYKYFQETLLERSNLNADDLRVTSSVIALARDNDIHPLVSNLEAVLERLSNRDARKFSEKYVKVALLTLLVPTGIYAIYSEYPIGQRFADIAIFRRPPILDPKYQFLIELKYLKKSEAEKLEEAAEEGRKQLQDYLSHKDIATRSDMVGYLMIVIGYEVKLLEQIKL